MPHELALRLLKAVYGFQPDVPLAEGERIEFSIHPMRVGYRHTHTLLWEAERVEGVRLSALSPMHWPNRFSRLIGDKVFGLLIAHLHVRGPATTGALHPRSVAPFRFGRPTGRQSSGSARLRLINSRGSSRPPTAGKTRTP